MLTSSGFMPLLSIRSDRADESGPNRKMLVYMENINRARKKENGQRKYETEKISEHIKRTKMF